MSIVRVSPELLAKMEEGALFEVVGGAAPMGARVVDVRLEDGGTVVAIEVDDGIEGDRLPVIRRVERTTRTLTEVHDR